jgi:tetratricopeptide (TPR) repeat protein
MTIHSSGEELEAVLAQLRAEEPLEQDTAQQALLHHECGVLEEAGGDDTVAMREYLAAYNSDPEFREPLEALVRLYTRRRDDKNLPKLLEALVDAAHTPAESARALRELAIYRHTIENDLAQARSCLEAAVESDPQDAAAWLEYELVAAREGDVEARMKALEARQNLTSDPNWQGLLLVELAELCAETGDIVRASNLLDTAAGLDGSARFRSRMALERVAAQAGDLELGAHALEGQAELIVQAIDDPEAGDRSGVPRLVCTSEYAADAWLRAGELRRRTGDAWGAVAALTGAAERIGDHALVARLRIAAVEATGDSAAVVELAREQLARGVGGAAGSALWVRVGRASEASGDLDAALEAYDKALGLDADNVVALTLRTDLLATGADPVALGDALEAQAKSGGSRDAQARDWALVAYVRAVRAGDFAGGKAALARSVELGTPPVRAQRLARSFAAMSNDDAWYAEATAALLELCEDEAERATLCFELARTCLVRGDDAGAVDAFSRLAGGQDARAPNAWLGRVLAAYAVGLREEAPAGRRDASLVQRVAESEHDQRLGRGLSVVAAMLAAQQGSPADAVTLLEREHEADPGDVVVALFLAGLKRDAGDVRGAAHVLSRVAALNADTNFAGTLQLEAGFLLWHARARAEAVEAFEQALTYAPAAAQLVLSWALRAADPDDLDARRRAIELSEDTSEGRAVGALERFGLAMAMRDGDGEARAALEQLEEIHPGGDLTLAGGLARLAHETSDGGALSRALEQLETLGGSATQLARAERFRVVRFVERDADASLHAARDWAESDASVHACFEWLAAAHVADDRDAEIAARLALAEELPEGAARDAVVGSAAIAQLLHRPGDPPAPIDSRAPSARLVNLELALPGSEPAQRAAALRAAAEVLGPEASRQAMRMAAWSDLVAGAQAEAHGVFKKLVTADPDDVASWEGLRLASESIRDWPTVGVALAQLGNLSRDDARSAELWEKAGMVLLEHTDAHDDAEIAFERALQRDRTRATAFDKLFRRVRSRNEDDRLLSLIEARLGVTEDMPEMTKMYWERARVLRRKGDQPGALKALKDVTMLEPDHVGALALAGEISIQRGDFAEAAPLLAKLATLSEAPQKQRLLSAIAAVDLYEKKLSMPDKALEVLSRLYKDGLSTLKVRERLARTAAKVGRWEEAITVLEKLMEERDTPKGRADAAKLAMVICRDKLKKPERAIKAVRRLLQEMPDDRDAIHLLVKAHVSDELRAQSVPRAKAILQQKLSVDPFDRERVELLADIADEQGDFNLRRTAFGVSLALGNESDVVRRSVMHLDSRSTQEPQIVLDAQAILAIADPDDRGPVAELFAQAAPVVSEALGPSLETEGVGRKQRVKEGDPLRIEISRWMGALGFGDFELFVGGRDMRGVKGVAGERPALIVGPAITAPLNLAGRSAVAREVFALRRGTTAVMYADDSTISSIVVAVSNDAGVHVPEPPYAVYHEVARVIQKAMNRRVRKAVGEVCQRILQMRQDPSAWAEAARRSIDRMALISSGDASAVVEQIVGPAESAARANMESNVRLKRLLSFALSSEYLGLRKKLGMGIP